MTHPNIDLIFEVSWEVCNKIGGIYTVLSSKSYHLQKKFGDKLFFIGPDFNNDECGLFAPENNKNFEITKSIPADIPYRVGRWNVPGKPLVILIDFKTGYQRLNQIYGAMWEKFGVDSLHAYGDYDEACAFSITAARVIEAIYKGNTGRYNEVIAHFNEWTTGMGLLYIKMTCPEIATVFTTHATSIGRSICGNNKPLYGYLKDYNGDQMAGELNMQSKHSLEKSAAHNADCFTAVSHITAKECEQLLEIYPGKVTPNGFEKEIAGTKTHRKSVRKSSREKILSIAGKLTGKIFPANTTIIATSGRNEYKNKGLDVFLDSISTIRNRKLAAPVLALVLVPGWTKEPRTDLLAKINRDSRVDLKTPNITHWINNEWEDAVFNRIQQLGFKNNVEDDVNVIYVPCYLNGTDGIFNISYYDFLPAVDITVFPSYYEPWGYTPLESIAFGVPTITTDLSGFGQWVLSNFPDENILSTGVGVVHRDDFNYNNVVRSIAELLLNFVDFPQKERKGLSETAVATSRKAEWSNFIRYYMEAFSIALDSAKNSLKRKQENKS